ncbi:putative reverse transcriptase domain-containing protein, partial [Tanacetum coccineum]
MRRSSIHSMYSMKCASASLHLSLFSSTLYVYLSDYSTGYTSLQSPEAELRIAVDGTFNIVGATAKVCMALDSVILNDNSFGTRAFASSFGNWFAMIKEYEGYALHTLLTITINNGMDRVGIVPLRRDGLSRGGVLRGRWRRCSDAEATNSVAIGGIHPRVTALEEIMPPKQMSQAAIAKLVADEVKKALDADRATRNTSGVGGSGNDGGAIELCRWFEKIESTFGISDCAERNKVKFAAATLQELCPEEEISRIEDELRNLRLRDQDIAAYTNRFNELGETCSSKPSTLNEAIRMAHGLMEHKVHGWKENNANQNKRKWESGNQGNNQGNRNNNRGDYHDNRRHNQNSNRRNGGARAMTQAQGENVNQGGHAPKCNKCNMFHFGNFPMTCSNCGKRGHKARSCHGKGIATGANAEPIRAC